MSCCDNSTNTVVGCCSIHGVVPAGVGVRWDSTGISGQITGVKVPAYTADGSGTTPITLGVNQRYWITHMEIVVLTAGSSIVYRGTAPGDYTIVNRVIIGGPLSANGGIVATLPFIRLDTAQDVYVKLANSDAFQVTGYGIIETITS
jgi:hypothetical protein